MERILWLIAEVTTEGWGMYIPFLTFLVANKSFDKSFVRWVEYLATEGSCRSGLFLG